MAGEAEDNFLKSVSKFLGEIQIILSVLLIISCVTTITVYSIRILNCMECDHPLIHQYFIGLVSFLSAAVLVNIFDLLSAFFLLNGSKQENAEKCGYWYRATTVSFILFTMMTMCFAVLLNSWLLLLVIVPSLIHKPFALWIVGRFVKRLSEAKGLLEDQTATLDCSRKKSATDSLKSYNSTALSSNARQKSPKKTTVFLLKHQRYSPLSFEKIPE